MPTVPIATTRTFIWFYIRCIIFKNRLHLFAPGQRIYKYWMKDYFVKLDLHLENVDLDRIKGKYFEGYGTTFKNYLIKDKDYFDSLIKEKIKFNIEPSLVLITEITGDGIAPHVDQHTVALNYYLEVNKSITTFWDQKIDTEGNTIPQHYRDGKLYKNDAKVYEIKDLKMACSFSAKKGECFLLNVRKIHNVFKLEQDVNRYAIRWGWQDYDYHTILNSIELINK